MVRALLPLVALSIVLAGCTSLQPAEDKTVALNRTIGEMSRRIAANPTNSRTYVARGYAKGQLGDLQGAVEDYTQAITLNPRDPEPYYQRAVVEIRRGEQAGGIKDLGRAIRLNPRFQSAYLS
jgi:tetratricopeptide (TPR) repeat protein